MLTALRDLETGAEPIPGYQLERFRGRGGFGEVWEARSPKGERVALKFLPCAQNDGASREVRAVRAIHQLSHPNLVKIYNVWCCPGYLVLAMELADGSLQDLFHAYQHEYGTPVPVTDLLPLFQQAAAALDFLHAKHHWAGGAVFAARHGDIKPANLLLFGDTLKLCDYGLACLTPGAAGSRPYGGTPGYFAPEMLRGWISHASDQYALAVSYCYLRGGRLPVPERSSEYATSDSTLARPDLDMLPAAERPAIARALANAPWDRWPSCGDLVAHLSRAVGLRPVAPAAVSSPQASAAERLHDERRREARVACSLEVALRLLGDIEPVTWTGNVQNLSPRGIGFVTSALLGSGTILGINPVASTSNETSPRLVRVVRTVPQPAGQLFLGCRFGRPLGEEDFRSLLALAAANLR